jgi:glyoxylase I family protein
MRDEQSATIRRNHGLQLISFSVPDVDETYTAIKAAVGDRAQPPFDGDDVRMFFVADPDGTVIEFVRFPDGARNPAEIHRASQGRK